MIVLYEDNHLIAVYKQNSEIVQGDKTGDETLADSVKAYIKQAYNKPGDVYLGIAHRIDRPVSGVVLFARTSKALARLNNMFRDGEIKKKYLAIIKERPPEDEAVIEHYLKKNEKKNKSFSHDREVKESKLAKLKYKILSRTDRYYLLDIELYTGRHHQIRAQLSHIGCAIRGDLKYGYPRSNKDGGISLHARSLEFVHPVKKEPVKIVAPLPKVDLWQLFKEHVE